MPQLKEGQVLLKSSYVSVDPGMSGFMDEGEDDSRGQKFELDKPITSRTVAEVIESNHNDYPEGTIIHGRLAWQKYQSTHPVELEKVDPDIASISTAVSILGVTGLSPISECLKSENPKKEKRWSFPEQQVRWAAWQDKLQNYRIAGS